MVVAAGWANVGSINLDHRSFALNDGLNLSSATQVVAGLAQHFLSDLDDAHELKPTAWSRPVAWARLPPAPPSGGEL